MFDGKDKDYIIKMPYHVREGITYIILALVCIVLLIIILENGVL